MAISNTSIPAATPTDVYTSSGDSAVTFMSICNHGGAAVVVDVHVIPSGGSATNNNIVISGLDITANDTYMMYHANEKIVLENGDKISVTSDIATVTVTVSSAAI